MMHLHPVKRLRSRSRTSGTIFGDINITPFVDVMLVLLIIFMIAAPAVITGVTIDVPTLSSGALTEESAPLVVSIDGDGTVFLADKPVAPKDVVPKLLSIADGGYNERIYIRADQNLSYGKVMGIMNTLQSAGFSRVALITKDPQEERP